MERERKFFSEMRETVKQAVLDQGAQNIVGMKVTENGITIETTEKVYRQEIHP